MSDVPSTRVKLLKRLASKWPKKNENFNNRGLVVLCLAIKTSWSIKEHVTLLPLREHYASIARCIYSLAVN
jgi:hypothetical protein